MFSAVHESSCWAFSCQLSFFFVDASEQAFHKTDGVL